MNLGILPDILIKGEVMQTKHSILLHAGASHACVTTVILFKHTIVWVGGGEHAYPMPTH